LALRGLRAGCGASAELVDLSTKAVPPFYPGALDNGSGMLVLKQISDLLDNVPHWMLFVDGGMFAVLALLPSSAATSYQGMCSLSPWKGPALAQ